MMRTRSCAARKRSWRSWTSPSSALLTARWPTTGCRSWSSTRRICNAWPTTRPRNCTCEGCRDSGRSCTPSTVCSALAPVWPRSGRLDPSSSSAEGRWIRQKGRSTSATGEEPTKAWRAANCSTRKSDAREQRWSETTQSFGGRWTLWRTSSIWMFIPAATGRCQQMFFLGPVNQTDPTQN